MTPLRQRMVNDMTVRGLAENTKKSYLYSVSGLAGHYGRSPDRISAQEVQDYLIYLHQERGLSWKSCNCARHAIRFFYRITLGLPEPHFYRTAGSNPCRGIKRYRRQVASFERHAAAAVVEVDIGIDQGLGRIRDARRRGSRPAREVGGPRRLGDAPPGRTPRVRRVRPRGLARCAGVRRREADAPRLPAGFGRERARADLHRRVAVLAPEPVAQ